MNIFLIGFMGSGKTTLGKQIAIKLGYIFIDQDSVIEEKQHKTISELFASIGELKFREIEHQTLVELAGQDNLVIATGGGAPCFFNNMQVMNHHGLSIYLKVPPKTLFQRLRYASAQRPLVANKTDDELQEFIISKLAERESFYSQSIITIESENILCSDIENAILEYKKK
jgi:shikimate kinase